MLQISNAFEWSNAKASLPCMSIAGFVHGTREHSMDKYVSPLVGKTWIHKDMVPAAGILFAWEQLQAEDQARHVQHAMYSSLHWRT